MKKNISNMTICSRPFEFEIFKSYYAAPLLIVGTITLAIIGLSLFFIVLFG